MQGLRKTIILMCLLILLQGCATVQPSAQPTAPAATVPEPTSPGEPSIPPTAPATEVPADESSIDAIAAGLQGLSFDDFLEESYDQLLLRSPQYLTSLGIAESLGRRNDQLDNLSDAYIRETQQLESAILELLRAFDRDGLSPEQQLSYDVYEWHLDDLVRGHEFMYHDYPLHHFLIGYHDDLVRFFDDSHPVADRQDATDYVTCLSQVDDQIEQLLQGLAIREERGIIPPNFVIQMTRQGISSYLQMRSPNPASIKAESLSVYTVFQDKLDEIEDLSQEEKQELLEAAVEAIESSFIPAFVQLLDYLDYLEPLANDDAGVWKFPDGDAYYAYMLRHETSTNLTAKEIHQIGLVEVDRIQAEMQAIFDELGYPQDENLSQNMGRAISEGGSYNTYTQDGRDEVIAAYETLYAEVEQQMDVYFDLQPQGRVVVVGDMTFGGGGGYYTAGSLDGSRPGAFHTGLGGSSVPKYRMPTLFHHEAVPGHHFQITLAQEMDLPFFRTDIFFNGHGEGWALYAEQLGQEMGLLKDPYSRLGQLHLQLLRAVRLVTDTGIHSMRWTRAEAKTYMNQAMGDPSGGSSHEVDRYIVLPAQATGYMVGMLKILELRQLATDRLGDQFDIKEFHNVVVGNGGVPVELLEQLVEDYVEVKLGQ